MYIVGWNTSGYLPEMDPIEVDSFEDAKAILVEELDRAGDVADTTAEHDDYDDVARDVETWIYPDEVIVNYTTAYWIHEE